MSSTVEELERRLQKMTQLNITLMVELDKRNKRIERLERQQAGELRVLDWREALDSERRHIDKALSTATKFRLELITYYKNRLDELVSDGAQLRAAMHRTNVDNHRMIEGLQSELDENQRTIEQLQTQLEDDRERIKALRAKVADGQKKIKNLRAQTESDQRTIDELNTMFDRAAEVLADYQKRSDVDRRTIDDLREELQLTTELDEEEIERLKNDLDKMRKAFKDNEDTIVAAALEEIDGHVRELEAQYSRRVQLEALREIIVLSRRKVGQFKAQHQFFSDDFDRFDAELEALYDRLDQKSVDDVDIEEIMTQLDSVVENIFELKNRNRIVQRDAIRDIFCEDVLHKAQSEIDISVPWMNGSIVNAAMLDKLEAHLVGNRNFVVKIRYGYGQDKADKRRDTGKVLATLKARFDKYRGRFHTHYADSHEKLFICDDKFYVVSSFNVLTFGGRGEREELGEQSWNQANLQHYRQTHFDFHDGVEIDPLYALDARGELLYR